MAATLNQVDLFNLIKGDLAPYLATLGGLLSIARDPWEVQELLAEAPGRFRVILAWDGEDTLGDHRSGIVAHKFKAIVSHNRGLALIKGTNLSLNRATDAPLMTLANQVRDRMRTMAFQNNPTSILLQYQGADLVKVDTQTQSLQLDAYELRWRFPAAITVLQPGDFRQLG
jgi:hypothetical protein